MINTENMEIQHIAIDEIRPNEWNPNVVDKKNMARLSKMIKSKGFKHPILLRPREDESGKYYEIVDGYHRWTIMKELEAETIPAVVQEMSETEAKIQTINANYLRGNPVPIKLANLIHELHKEYDIADLESMLPYDKVEIRDSLELLKLPPDMERMVTERTQKEKRLEPVFISATIHKDKEKSLHDFIEQAMLESEATFCEIKVKIECGEESKEEIIKAVQNLQKVDVGTDYAAAEDAPQVVRFALFPEQFQVLDQALMKIIGQEELTKNARGRALELMAADYLAGAEPEEE